MAAAPPASGAAAAEQRADSAAVEDALAELKVSLATLAAQVDGLAARIGRTEDEMAAANGHIKALRAAGRIARTARPAAARGFTARVLAVDVWDGHPSVVVEHGREIRFLGEGDSVGGYVLKKADGPSQQALFLAPAADAAKTTAPPEDR